MRQDYLKAIGEFINKNYSSANEDKPVSADEPLFDNGILDSFDAVQLVGFLETEFKVKIAPEELARENFMSIRALAEFMQRKAAK